MSKSKKGKKWIETKKDLQCFLILLPSSLCSRAQYHPRCSSLVTPEVALWSTKGAQKLTWENPALDCSAFIVYLNFAFLMRNGANGKNLCWVIEAANSVHKSMLKTSHYRKIYIFSSHKLRAPHHHTGGLLTYGLHRMDNWN